MKILGTQRLQHSTISGIVVARLTTFYKVRQPCFQHAIILEILVALAGFFMMEHTYPLVELNLRWCSSDT